MKNCYDCKELKDESAFYTNKAKPDGLSSQCIPCTSRRVKRYYKEHPEKFRAYWKLTKEERIEKNKKKYDEQSGELYILRRTVKRKYHRVKADAKVRKINFNISFEEFSNIVTKPCYYCNGELATSAGSSLDRINNDKSIGYIVENVLPCCGRCNQTRNVHWTVEETKFMIQAVLEFRNREKFITR